MRSKFAKLVLTLVLGVFLLTFPEAGHAAPKKPVKKTKPAAAMSAKPATNATLQKNTALNPGAKALSGPAPTGTTKNSKTEFKKYREALLAQHLLDKIISVGSRLKTKSNKFSISNKLRETIIFRNELERDLAILAGIDTMTQVDTDTFVVTQEGIDPGTVSMPSSPGFSAPSFEYGCGAQENDCNSTARDEYSSCGGNCSHGGTNHDGSLNFCGQNCYSDLNNDNSDCRSQRSACDDCKAGGGSNKECTGKLTVTNDIEELINQLLGYLDVINEIINMQNFTHELDTSAIVMYNNVVDMTHQSITVEQPGN